MSIIGEFLKQVDWEGLFKGCFSIICIGGFIVFIFLLLFGRACSSESNTPQDKIHSENKKICSQCNGRGTWERLDEVQGKWKKVPTVCSACHGTGFEN